MPCERLKAAYELAKTGTVELNLATSRSAFLEIRDISINIYGSFSIIRSIFVRRNSICQLPSEDET